jgi:Bacteriophage HK97-gp10, putative tail-component
MADVRFVPDPQGLAALASTPDMATFVTHVTDSLRDTARSITPRKTGHLADSYTTDVEHTPRGVVGTLGNTARYATPIEFGGVNNPPFAPMRKAARSLGLDLKADE